MKELLLLLLMSVCFRHGLAGRQRTNGACTGTSYGRSTVDDPDQRYNILKTHYANCTYVEGNLEISYQQDIDRDFTFLKDIREVTGYVLIALSYLRTSMLPNLRVIRGTSLLEGNALTISHNYMKQNLTVGLHELGFRSLQEIIRGNVTIEMNNRLCHAESINWTDIVSPGASVSITYDKQIEKRECPQCLNKNGGCWGDGPENYQQLSKTICDKTCDYRCRGKTAADCCHKSCAAGCTGPLNTQCLACRNFTNGDECLESCPPRFVYDPSSYSNVPNPNFKYSYGAQCIEQCPSNFLTESETCVKQCDKGKEEKDGFCVDCDGPCPKTCEGLEKTETLNSKNYEGLKDGCTIIQKNIIIGVVTFEGDSLHGIDPLTPEDLEIFKTVKVINGFLSIQAKHERLTNLSFFENLTEIKGREHYSSTPDTLHIQQSTLEYLGLTSLKKIAVGNVRIRENEQLCYVNKSMWTGLLEKGNEQKVRIARNKDPIHCSAEGRVCDAQCMDIGCWGPGPEQCVKCKNKKIGNKCVLDCDYENGEYYAGNGTCKFCHEECMGGCSGPGNDKCNTCKNFKDGPFCVPACPAVKYNNSYICESCHDNCVEGCMGPENTIGENGCSACAKVKLNQAEKLIECLHGGAYGINTTCDEEYYYERRLIKGSNTLTQVCQECHPECRNCTAKGSYHCGVCKNFKRGDECVAQCGQDEYYNENFECKPCNHECKGGCKGPTDWDCKFKCRQYKIETGSGKFQCATSCTKDYPYEDNPFHCVANCTENMFPNERKICRPCHSECVGGCTGDRSKDCVACKNVTYNGECWESCPTGTIKDEENICQKFDDPVASKSTDSPKSGLSSPLIAGVSVLVITLLVLFIVLYSVCKRKYKDNLMELTTTLAIKQLEHPEENEPLTPSGVAPNQAQLRLIKENEMKKMSKLGSGAFGTVYKGVWTPEGEKVRIPIAIKVLQEGITPKAAAELLEEGYVMASVDHPCVLRLLGVCCGQETMLITQLMPMGALLDFTREHKGRISSQHLLLWSHQIAQGMVYLEDKHIIHRDLAARNVLVLSPNQVKITDFGLAKFLEIEEHEYKSDGGKMPIKWLALECIMTRKFTHKSDVWSFGVTLWELMTFGQKPYERVRARDMPEVLERGERLLQPPICTIDVYMLMVKCWLLDPESRPTFKQLSDELDRMAKDPSRYLVIQNDGSQTLPMTSKDDFYKSLLSDGGEADPELFMDADDYLQPSVCTSDPAYRFPEVEDPVFDENRDYLNDAVTFSGTPGSVGYKHKGFPRTSSASLSRYSQDPTIASHLQRQRSNASQRSNGRSEENYQNAPIRGGSTSGPEDYMPIRNGATLIGMDNMEYHALLQSNPPRTNPGVMNRQMSTPVQHSPLKYPPVVNPKFASSQPLLNGQVDYQNLNNASSGIQDILTTPKRSSSVSQATSDGYLSEHDYINSVDPPPVSPTESTV